MKPESTLAEMIFFRNALIRCGTIFLSDAWFYQSFPYNFTGDTDIYNVTTELQNSILSQGSGRLTDGEILRYEIKYGIFDTGKETIYGRNWWSIIFISLQLQL